MIDREDMLELTRRMTPSRTSFTRVAGGYMEPDGEIDESFNVNFLNLSAAEKEKNLAIAKAVPFAATNVNLRSYAFGDGAEQRKMRTEKRCAAVHFLRTRGCPVPQQGAVCDSGLSRPL